MTWRLSAVSSLYSRSVGSSRRSPRLKKSRNSFVVPYSIGRPTSSRLPSTRISERSSSSRSVADESTPRISSISGRVIGWRYATIASVSSCARDSRTGRPAISCWTHDENAVFVRN